MAVLIDYATLQASLPADTIDNLLKEYLLTQVGDEGFDGIDAGQLQQALATAKMALARAELVVEYSEEDESIAVRRKEDLLISK